MLNQVLKGMTSRNMEERILGSRLYGDKVSDILGEKWEEEKVEEGENAELSFHGTQI